MNRSDAIRVRHWLLDHANMLVECAKLAEFAEDNRSAREMRSEAKHIRDFVTKEFPSGDGKPRCRTALNGVVLTHGIVASYFHRVVGFPAQ